MRIQYVNDLHMEFGHTPVLKKTGDVLVVAGDLCTWDTREAGLKWLNEQADKYECVLFVLGNHEFYNCDAFDEVIDWWHENAIFFNLLDNTYAKVNGVNFIGTTLWTDAFEYNDPYFMKLKYRNMNDRKFISPEVWAEENKLATEFLNDLIPDADVVITHHLPFDGAVAKRWKNNPWNPFFANCNGKIPGAFKDTIWIHGHTHDTIDTEYAGYRILCNPYGYKRYAVNNEYDNGKYIEIN